MKKGFTLIELMIVIAIVGSIAAVAIPSYLDYIAKSQASEAVTLTGAVRSPLKEYYASNGVLPSVGELGVQSEGKYVLGITIFSTATNVVIQAQFKPTGVNISIQSETFAMASDSELKNWQCGLGGAVSSIHTSTGYNYLPTSCR